MNKEETARRIISQGGCRGMVCNTCAMYSKCRKDMNKNRKSSDIEIAHKYLNKLEIKRNKRAIEQEMIFQTSCKEKEEVKQEEIREYKIGSIYISQGYTFVCTRVLRDYVTGVIMFYANKSTVYIGVSNSFLKKLIDNVEYVLSSV